MFWFCGSNRRFCHFDSVDFKKANNFGRFSWLSTVAADQLKNKKKERNDVGDLNRCLPEKESERARIDLVAICVN